MAFRRPSSSQGFVNTANFVSLDFHASVATLETAYPAASNSGKYGIAYAGANAETYESDGTSWLLAGLPEGFVSSEIYADVAALETAFPSADNETKFGLALLDAVVRTYESYGTDWEVIGDPDTFVSGRRFASVATLESQFPAASNDEYYALVDVTGNPTLVPADGSVANPWNTTTAGEAGILALETQADTDLSIGDYGVIDTDGTPVVFRYNGSGTWYRPFMFGVNFGTFSAEVINEQDPSAAGFTESVPAGGAVDYNSTVAGKIGMLSPTAGGSTSSATKATRGAANYLAMVVAGAKSTWATGALAQAAIFGVRTSDGGGIGQFIGMSPSGSTWFYYSGSTFTASAQSITTETTIEFYFDRVKQHQLIFFNRSATPAIDIAANVVSTGGSEKAIITSVTLPGTTKQTLEFDRYAAGYLT